MAATRRWLIAVIGAIALQAALTAVLFAPAATVSEPRDRDRPDRLSFAPLDPEPTPPPPDQSEPVAPEPDADPIAEPTLAVPVPSPALDLPGGIPMPTSPESLRLPLPRLGPMPAPPSPPAETSTPDGPRDAESVDQPPRRIHAPDPVYPVSERRRRRTAVVTARMIVSPEGEVSDLTIVENTGARSFADAVRATLPRWRFEAARHNGEAVPVWVRYTFRFQLRD